MTQHSLISAIRLTVILVLLATAAEAAGAGKEFQYYTVELVNSSVSSAPLPLAPGQAVLATVWNHGEEAAPVRIEAVDAMTGESVGGVQTKSAPGVVSVMVLPLKASVAHYVMFQAEGVPIRAKVSLSLRVLNDLGSADSLTGPWGRTFELGATAKAKSVMTEPLIVTDAHDLTLRMFNQGGRAAVTVRGWDPISKKELVGETKIVEQSRGALVTIPSSVAAQLTPLVAGGWANGLLQLQFIVEPLDGAADVLITAEANSAFGDVTLKRGYIADSFPTW